jgi:hypothetical protein
VDWDSRREPFGVRWTNDWKAGKSMRAVWPNGYSTAKMRSSGCGNIVAKHGHVISHGGYDRWSIFDQRRQLGQCVIMSYDYIPKQCTTVPGRKSTARFLPNCCGHGLFVSPAAKFIFSSDTKQ